jgi:carboxymethylenebutenolidase
MRTFEIGVSTAEGTMNCYIAHPDGNGPFPAVILYMDVPGIRPELHRFAERIAAEGYVCVLPDLYYREGKVSFDLTKGQAELQRMFSYGAKLTNAMIVSDTRGILTWLESQPFATSATGVIGYCMSGQFVVSVAGSFPERIRAGASLYGVRIVTRLPDSPHLLAGKIKAELYLGFAAHDPYVEDFVIPELREALDRHHVAHTIETHPGTEHGFCFPERPAYRRDAAERVWSTVFDLYRRRLK